jgi:hypothetical protein
VPRSGRPETEAKLQSIAGSVRRRKSERIEAGEADGRANRRKKREAEAKAEAAPTFQRSPAEPEAPRGGGNREREAGGIAISRQQLAGDPIEAAMLRPGDPRRTEAKSKDGSDDLLRPVKTAEPSGEAEIARESGGWRKR